MTTPFCKLTNNGKGSNDCKHISIKFNTFVKYSYLPLMNHATSCNHFLCLTSGNVFRFLFNFFWVYQNVRGYRSIYFIPFYYNPFEFLSRLKRLSADNTLFVKGRSFSLLNHAKLRDFAYCLSDL